MHDLSDVNRLSNPKFRVLASLPGPIPDFCSALSSSSVNCLTLAYSPPVPTGIRIYQGAHAGNASSVSFSTYRIRTTVTYGVLCSSKMRLHLFEASWNNPSLAVRSWVSITRVPISSPWSGVRTEWRTVQARKSLTQLPRPSPLSTSSCEHFHPHCTTVGRSRPVRHANIDLYHEQSAPHPQPADGHAHPRLKLVPGRVTPSRANPRGDTHAGFCRNRCSRSCT